jgi:phosphoadenosine phosphosulfate reductase
MCEEIDRLTAIRTRRRLEVIATQSRNVLRAFVNSGGGYLSISWGKDSLVCAHLLHELERNEGVVYPAIWVRVRRWENPDCQLVRDAFLERWPLAAYEEIVVEAGPNRAGGTSALGFREAARRHGDRHVSGVRGDESKVRRIVVSRWGTATERTCRPIARWTTEQVFAYLALHDLPVHPVYAYTLGGRLDRLHLRTGSLGGSRGGSRRAEWEAAYYPAELLAARR